MNDQIITLNLGKSSLLTDADIKRLDSKGFFAIDAFGKDTFSACISSYECDPWEYLRRLRENLHNTRLSMTLCGQCLLGNRCFADDTVEYFVEKAVENGIDIIRVYDALNDPRNLTTTINAAKRVGAFLQAAMIYTESRVHSVAFFAGYAVQLASMGADSICICDPQCLLTPNKVHELICSIKESVQLPIAVSVLNEAVANAASEAGADMIDRFDSSAHDNNALPHEFTEEIELVRADAGLAPLAAPIADIITEQAQLNVSLGRRYATVTDDFKALVKGCYGRTPAPIEQSFITRICGNEALVLVRPADMLSSELELLRERSAPWYEQEEDVLTLALFGRAAEVFFEVRKAQKYALDIPHANASLGIHTV